MISAEHARFFTHDWSITILEHPSVRFVHMPLSRLDEWVGLLTATWSPPHDATMRSKGWDKTAIDELRASIIKKHTQSLTKFEGLNMMVLVDEQLVGGGNYSLLPTGEVNIGITSKESARGKGLGKLTMQVLIKLGQRLGIEHLEAGHDEIKSGNAGDHGQSENSRAGRDQAGAWTWSCRGDSVGYTRDCRLGNRIAAGVWWPSG